MTTKHLETALAALTSKPPDARAALKALEAGGRVVQGMETDPVASGRAAAARWAVRAILRSTADLTPIIRAIEAVLVVP